MAERGQAELRAFPAGQPGDLEPVTFAAVARARTRWQWICGRCFHADVSVGVSFPLDLACRATRRRRQPQPGIRNSSRRSWPQPKARKTDSTSPQRCGLTRMPCCSSARSSDSEIAAQSSTSTRNSATLRASASGESGLRTSSLRSTSRPRRRVTSSRCPAVSSTGEMRSCEMGRAIVTTNPNASVVPVVAMPSEAIEKPPNKSFCSLEVCQKRWTPVAKHHDLGAAAWQNATSPNLVNPAAPLLSVPASNPTP